MAKRVLIAPLDWGLGHTTRCIPIIRKLLQRGCIVYVACHPAAQQLLSREFSTIRLLPIEGYGIRYASTKRNFALKILWQIPKIVLTIYNEQKWLKKAVISHQIELVISDNRYGLFHKTIPSVFITHQLAIQTPFRLMSRMVQQINYTFIRQFSTCWVPDYPSHFNIAGILSHPDRLPETPVVYIGPLSRLLPQPAGRYLYKWLIVLSGPEPQRTLLEKQLVAAMETVEGRALFVRGLPLAVEALPVPKHCEVVNHLSSTELQEAFAQSEFIISRSGYTTVMEILAMQKKSILIPTPGQTEQEYLALHLRKQHWCNACDQEDDIVAHLLKAQDFPYQLPQLPASTWQDALDDLLLS